VGNKQTTAKQTITKRSKVVAKRDLNFQEFECPFDDVPLKKKKLIDDECPFSVTPEAMAAYEKKLIYG
jgi:hypothetical protein